LSPIHKIALEKIKLKGFQSKLCQMGVRPKKIFENDPEKKCKN
jgi:hypothetical protein